MNPDLDFARFLNIRSAYGPAYRSDGRLLFLSDLSGTPELWTIDAPGAWPEQITFRPERVLYARPDHAHGRLILGGDAGGNERFQLALLAADGLAETPLDPDPDVIHEFGGWAPEDSAIAYASNRRDPAFFDIYTQPVDPPGPPRRVYTCDGSARVAAWTPDGRALIVSVVEKPSNNNLYLVPLDGGAPRLLTPHEGDAVYEEANCTPDGKSLVVISDAGREFAALVRLDLASGAWETLAAPDWDVDGCRLSPDGRQVAYMVNVDGYSALHVRALDGDTDREAPGLPRGVVAVTGSSATGYAPGLAWAPDSARLAFSLSSPARTLDVWEWDLAADRVTQVTRSGRAGIPADAFADPELIHYPTFDGRMIPAFFFRPAGGDGAPLPCIVHVHGGPESQTRATFSPIFQYFVNRGYAILAPNVRGSSGYGRTYVHLDDVERRPDSVRDLAAAVDWLRAGGVVAPDRIAVMGGSYGGFMTLAALTRYPDLWAAGVDIVGIANFETFLEHTGPWRRKLREAEYGRLEEDRAVLRALSPIHQVDAITAPLLVIHGANDPRVPVGEAEQIVAELRARARPVDLLIFPDEGHGVAKLANRLIAYPAIAAFLDRYMGAGPG